MITRFFCSALLLLPLAIQGQVWIKGQITDRQQQPLAGVNVYIQGTYDGAFSDSLGRFGFQSHPNEQAILEARFLGFRPYQQNLKLQGDTVSTSLRLQSSTRAVDAVIITAGSFEASDEKKGVVLRTLDILTTAGSNGDIPGAINTLPGTAAVGEEGQLFVRGGAASETQTFIDGLRVGRPYGARVPDLPARGRFSPYLFKGTLFSSGGYSAAYGQALSAALILETQDLPASSQTSLSLMSVGGSIGHTHRWKRAALTASLDLTELGPYTRLIPQRQDWVQAPSTQQLTLHYQRHIRQTGRMKVFAQRSRNRLALYTPGFDPENPDYFAMGNQYTYGQLSYQELLGEQWLLKVAANYNADAQQISLPIGDLTLKQNSSQSRLAVHRPLGDRVNLRMGTTFWWQDNTESLLTAGDSMPLASLLTEKLLATYIEADISPLDKLGLRLGLRQEYSSLLQQTNLAPRLSAAWKTSPNGQVSAAYGRFFQNPDFSQMRYTQALDFELATHYILNYQWMHKGRIFRVEAYQKTYQQLARLRAPQAIDYLSAGAGFARGLDFFWRDRKSIKNLDYWLSYSYLDTERWYREFPTYGVPHFASTHNAALVAKYFWSKLETQVGLTYRYASPRRYHNPNLPGWQQASTTNYHDLSLNASHLMRIKGHLTIIHASISNVLGRQHLYGYRYAEQPDAEGIYPGLRVGPAAPRTFFLGVFLTLNHSS